MYREFFLDRYQLEMGILGCLIKRIFRKEISIGIEGSCKGNV